MYFQKKKTEILKGRGGSRLWYSKGIGGGGGNAFWNFRRQGGGVKTWKPSMVGYGYFLELPIFTDNYCITDALSKFMSHTQQQNIFCCCCLLN